MSHANGKIYSEVVNGKLVGINTDDVRLTIGLNSDDVMTLCSSEKNNKFSKHKPLRGTSPIPTTPVTASTGSDGAPAGSNPRYGLLVPTNTAAQLGLSSASRFLKPLAWRASTRSGGISHNVHNYTYLHPRPGTDYGRLPDYDGYDHNAPEPWTVSIVGATAMAPGASGQTQGMALSVDTFDTATITFAMSRPNNASLSFKDLFVTSDFYFMVELYKNDQSITSDTDVPEAVLVGTTKVSAMDYGFSFTVKVSKIKSLLGFSGDGQQTFTAVLGINRVSSSFNPASYEERENGAVLGYAVLNTDALRNNILAGEGSIPPWSVSLKPFIGDIKLQSYSKLQMQATGYAHPTSSTYSALPSTAINYGADGIRLKMSVKNLGTSAFTFNDSAGKNRVQIQAHGSYDTSHPSYSSMCLTSADSKWKDLTISSSASFANATALTIASQATNSAVYMQGLGFMPIGRTMSFTLRVSTDGGNTWVITGSFSGAFIVS